MVHEVDSTDGGGLVHEVDSTVGMGLVAGPETVSGACSTVGTVEEGLEGRWYRPVMLQVGSVRLMLELVIL